MVSNVSASASSAMLLLVMSFVPLMSASLDGSKGCCFSVGFGSMMKPCCLKVWSAGGEVDCQVGQRLGGAIGYTDGPCPATAAVAAKVLHSEAVPLPGFVAMADGGERRDAAKQNADPEQLPNIARAAVVVVILAAAYVAVGVLRGRRSTAVDGGDIGGPLLQEGS